MKPIIRVHNVSKRYHIGRLRLPYYTLRDSLADAIKRPFIRRSKTAPEDTIWALENVSFEVKPGESVGIIGRNGAGKSTMLKLLSRVTEPTTGRIELYGRSGSLLEVGTGFHPELTGRDNTFLNGAILGMGRREIARKFDEIVAFAEVERFIDTPVKHYSSGMYLRLAFAVAAHLEPEILIVDEVLAVGDLRFQRKCLDKMQDVASAGRTVLFVSHSMEAVGRLCPRIILIEQGAVVRDGPAAETIGSYLRTGLGLRAERAWPDSTSAPGNDIVKLVAVRVRNERAEIAAALDIRRPIEIEMEYEVVQAGRILTPNLHFYNEEGVCVFTVPDLDPEWRARPRPCGRYLTSAVIPGNLLAEGTLFVGAAISTMNPVTVHFFERDVVAFQVMDSLNGDSARGDYGGPMPGVVRPALQWRTRVLTNEEWPTAAATAEICEEVAG